MSLTQISDKRGRFETGSPYKDLYIYFLKGHLASDSEIFYKDFIGNWEEDEFSFLFPTIKKEGEKPFKCSAAFNPS